MISTLSPVDRRRIKRIDAGNHRARVAFHEAGHAVAATAQELAINSVAILGPNDPSAGATSHPRIADPFAESVVLLAGPIAESLCLGGDPREYFFNGGGQDMAMLKSLFESRRGSRIAGDIRTTPEYRKSFQRADAIVRRHWLAIESLAENLNSTQTFRRGCRANPCTFWNLK